MVPLYANEFVVSKSRYDVNVRVEHLLTPRGKIVLENRNSFSLCDFLNSSCDSRQFFHPEHALLVRDVHDDSRTFASVMKFRNEKRVSVRDGVDVEERETVRGFEHFVAGQISTYDTREDVRRVVSKVPRCMRCRRR